MNRKLFLQLLLISLSVSFVLGAAIITGIRSLNEAGEGPVQNPALKFMARVIERGGPYQATLQVFEAMRIKLGLGIMPVWIVGQDGEIYAETSPYGPLPVEWKSLVKPRKVHGIVAHYRPFHLTPDYMIIRLDSYVPTFLMVRIPNAGAIQRTLLGQSVFLFGTMAASAFAGLLITFVYLRQKSLQAKDVLGRLERGDLKARFPITRLDEAGSLMTDFNRMADAIERLVARVEETDRARQELLQELGHDLRTPMTSLRASADTLLSYGGAMSEGERERFVRIIQAESHYFLRMIDDLFFIAEVGDPRYRKTAEEVDLTQLLKAEIQQREENDPKRNHPIFSRLVSDPKPVKVVGDPILLKRLFRNALQNARKYARTSIEVTVERIKAEDGLHRARIRVLDDGPGIEPDEAANFGKRRTRRFSIDRTLSNSEISLGLGSVIMAAIVRVHGGTLSVRNLKEAGLEQTGTELLIELPV
ncbi:MAG: HAMP domain-containing histidine kinase [Nitrospirae bacterium]|nr:HAMP domain-containing histidine kinase [Nitrospirota bacterium]